MHYLVERNGRYKQTIMPGMNFLIPFFDRIGYKVDMRERKVGVVFGDLKTKDNEEIVCNSDVYVQVVDAKKVAYETGNVDETLRLRCAIEMKKLIKSKTLHQVLADAQGLDDMLLQRLKPHEQAWGVEINYIDIHKIHSET